MATRRIKDITNTATTFASDDFIALDGSTQGTRKMDKDDLIAEVSAGVSGDYLEEANNLSDVASVPDSKGNLEVPDVGTAPNEVPMNGMLGSMAYQSSEGISVAKAEVETLEVTDKVTGSLGIGGSPSYDLHVTNPSTAASIGLTGTGGSKDTWTVTSSDSGGKAVLNLTNADTGTTVLQLHQDNKLVLSSGGAIDFGSNANASGMTSELLDDYETGTWTPALSSTATAPVLSYSAQTGSYTKVGNMVTCHARVRVNTITSSGTGGLTITGLPFATQDTVNLQNAGSIGHAFGFGTSSSGCPTHLTADKGTNTLLCKTLKNSAGVVSSFNETAAADLSSSAIDFSITYTTD